MADCTEAKEECRLHGSKRMMPTAWKQKKNADISESLHYNTYATYFYARQLQLKKSEPLRAKANEPLIPVLFNPRVAGADLCN